MCPILPRMYLCPILPRMYLCPILPRMYMCPILPRMYLCPILPRMYLCPILPRMYLCPYRASHAYDRLPIEFLYQGGTWMPKSGSGRIIIGSFLISSVCIMASYTSNLVAHLAVTAVKFPFNTVDEMVKQDTVTWGVVEGASLYDHLQVCGANGLMAPVNIM